MTTRVSTAESKLTKDALTTTIGSYYTTSSDVDTQINAKGYATVSQVEQTATSLTATFSASGGYNFIRNSYVDTSSFEYGFNTGQTIDSEKLEPGKIYTLSICGRKNSSSNTGYPLVYIWESGWAWSANAQVLTTYDSVGSVTFTLPTTVDVSKLNVSLYHYPLGSTGSSYFKWVQLTEGSVAHPWSPHPAEVYDGITTIDKDGVKVSQSNYSGYTQMSASGFYVNNGSENVISCTSSGLTVKGTITGSAINGGTITGTTINNGSGTFKVDSNGALTATNANITGTINATAGTFAGTITTNKIMKAYGAVYVGTEIWGGFTSTSGSYVSNSPLTLKATTTLNIEAGDIYLKPTTEVVCGTSSAYKNLRAREIYAQEIVYTDTLRGRTGSTIDSQNLNIENSNGFLQFNSGYGVIRVVDDNQHLYLQTGSTSGNTSSEVRCTLYQSSSAYANLRAHNVCAQNAVYAAGVNVSSDRDRKRDIELYETDALYEVCTTPVYTYHLDTDLDEEIKRIGIIMQEAPLDAIDLSGKGVDLYQMVTMLWKAVQQLNAKIEG